MDPFQLKAPETVFVTNHLNPKQKELVDQILQSQNFFECQSFRDQLGLVFNGFKENKVDITYKDIGEIFGIKRNLAKYHISKYLEQPAPVGRPSLLNDEEDYAVHDYVCQKFASGEPATYADIHDFLCQTFKKDVLLDSLRNYIRKSSLYTTIEATPAEPDRMTVPQEEIIDYFVRLFIDITDIPAELVFNLDESGFSSWADREKITIIIPASANDTQQFYPVPRNEKRVTLLGCVAADGSSLKPLLVIPRKTLDDEVLKSGYTFEKVEFVHRENGFITAELFDYWAENIFFPEVIRRKELFDDPPPAVVILDGCTCHTTDYFLDNCTELDIIPIFLPPHSSHLLQPLDLGVFGQQKKRMKYIGKDKEDSTGTTQIKKILKSWRSATDPSNITGAFTSAGIDKYLDEDGQPRMRIDLQKSRFFQDLQIDSIPDLKKTTNQQ